LIQKGILQKGIQKERQSQTTPVQDSTSAGNGLRFRNPCEATQSSEAVSTLPPPGKAVLAPTPAPAAAPATTPITDVAAQIAAIRANAATENMINQANREAKVATMGLKAAKDIIG
jgi:hypothetical protein